MSQNPECLSAEVPAFLCREWFFKQFTQRGKSAVYRDRKKHFIDKRRSYQACSDNWIWFRDEIRMLQNQFTVSISKHWDTGGGLFGKRRQIKEFQTFFFPVNLRRLSAKPSLIHSCPVTAQSAQRSEREQMWQNHSVLKWHKPGLPSSSQGPHTSVSQSSAGQLWWREISSNEMEHEKSGEIATNKVKSGSWRDKQIHLQQI